MLQVSIYVPEGTRYNFDLPSPPRRGDEVVIELKGVGTVQSVRWKLNPITDVQQVVVWLKDWRPE
jgi:hypothetical protein